MIIGLGLGFKGSKGDFQECIAHGTVLDNCIGQSSVMRQHELNLRTTVELNELRLIMNQHVPTMATETISLPTWVLLTLPL